MKLSKTIFENAVRVKIQFTYNQYITRKTKESGAKGSKTLRAWHRPQKSIPHLEDYSKEYPGMNKKSVLRHTY